LKTKQETWGLSFELISMKKYTTVLIKVLFPPLIIPPYLQALLALLVYSFPQGTINKKVVVCI